MSSRLGLIPFALTMGIYCLIALFLLVPWQASHLVITSLNDLTVDRAFVIAQPELFRSGAQYGPGVLFTYGPWGMLITGLTLPKYYPVIVLLNVIVASIFALAAASTVMKCEAGVLKIAALTLMLATLVAFWTGGIDQGYWLFPSLYVGLYTLSRKQLGLSAGDLALAIAATAAAGWIGLIKFNLFVFGFAIQFIILLVDLKSRRLPSLFLIWLAVTCAAWLAADQDIRNFPRWVLACLDLSGGYSDAMSKGFFKPYNEIVVAILLVIEGCFLAMAWLVAPRIETRAMKISRLAVCVVCGGLAWQHIVGGNQIEQGIGEIFTALWFLFAISPPSIGARSRRLAPTASGLLALVLGIGIVSSCTVLDMPAMSGEVLAAKFNAFFQIIGGRFTAYRTSWEALMASVRESLPVKTDIAGSADIYPQDTAVVIANPQFHYAPRPAYLSLNAHTTALAEANAAYLKSSSPDAVFFQVLSPARSVNNRYPTTADGPSWPELMARYDLHDATPDFLILKKLASPIPFKFVPVSQQNIGWKKEVRLDGGSRLIWAKVHIKPSFVGRVVKLLYKSPHVTLQENLADGTQKEYQIVPALGEAGFLLSPGVFDTASFARLMQTSAADPVDPEKAVTVIQFRTESATSWFWSKTIGLELFELDIASQGVRPVPAAVASLIRLGELQDDVGSCLFPPSPIKAPEVSRPVLLFHAPCSTHIQVPKDVQAVTLSYGLRYIPDPSQPATDGAGIQIAAIGPDQAITENASRYLDPVKRKLDRGEQQITLSWKPGSVTQLRIKFDPGPKNDPIYDHTYISNIEFH